MSQLIFRMCASMAWTQACSLELFNFTLLGACVLSFTSNGRPIIIIIIIISDDDDDDDDDDKAVLISAR